MPASTCVAPGLFQHPRPRAFQGPLVERLGEDFFRTPRSGLHVNLHELTHRQLFMPTRRWLAEIQVPQPGA